MYFGLFRIGELTWSDHCLKARDVQIGTNKKKLMFILRTSKTHDQDSKPQTIKINSVDYDAVGNQQEFSVENDRDFCPFKIVRTFLQVRKSRRDDAEPFFVFADRSPVMPHHLRDTLKSLLTKCGLDFRCYGSHSLRAGRSVDLFDLGVDLDTICKLGRWRSGAIYTYLKP